MNLDSYLTPHRKINSKWIKDQNVKPEIMKLLKENIRQNICDLGLDEEFFNRTPKTWPIEVKID